MFLIRGLFLFQLAAFLWAVETPELPSMKTGNRLAVLKFEGWGVSEPLTAHMTEEFRNTMRRLKIFQVQDRGITEQINIFYPKSDDYWACWSKECAIELGRMLDVNYVIAGNIQNKSDKEFMINARLFSVDMETMANEFALSSKAINDSLLLEMKKLAYSVSGLPIPDTLSVGSDTSQVAILDRNIVKRKWIKLPPIPGKIKSLLMSTVLPGSGQLWSNKKYPGLGFMGTEATLGLAALIAFSKYNKAWSGFQDTYSSYRDGTDPHDLLVMRPQITQYAEDTRKYNLFMKNIRYVGLSIWTVNMIHAYLVGPDDDFFDGVLFFEEDEYAPPSANRVTGSRKRWGLFKFFKKDIGEKRSVTRFSVNGLLLPSIITSASLVDYTAYFDLGLAIQTPFGLNLGSIYSSLGFERINYSLYPKDDGELFRGSANIGIV